GGSGITRLVARLEECAKKLRQLIAAETPGAVRWADSGARHLALHYSPVDVAQELSALMTAQSCAWVLTSATLAVGDDFSHYKRRAGLARVRALRYESPFDFLRQALLYLPEGLGDPGSEQYTREVIRTVMPVIEA